MRRCMIAEREAARTARIRDMVTGGMGWGLRRETRRVPETHGRHRVRRCCQRTAPHTRQPSLAHCSSVRWSLVRAPYGEGDRRLPPCRRSKGESERAAWFCRRSSVCAALLPVERRAQPQKTRCTPRAQLAHPLALPHLLSCHRLLSPWLFTDRQNSGCSAPDNWWKRETLRTRRAERRINTTSSRNKRRKHHLNKHIIQMTQRCAFYIDSAIDGNRIKRLVRLRIGKS